MSEAGSTAMNMHDKRFSHTVAATSGEVLEQLTVFLPASVVRTLREQVPAGQRRAFIARALQQALQRQQAPLRD